MFCPNCGSKNPDSAAFCERCGSALTETAPVKGANTGYTQPVYTPAPQPTPVSPVYPAPAVRVNTPRPPYSVIGAVKSVGASPLFLIAAIAFSLSLLFSLIGLLGGGLGTMGILMYYLNRAGLAFYNSIFGSVYRYLTIAGFLFLIPDILYTIGMWITFGSAASRGNNSMSVAGITMIRVMQIISLVFRCIFFAVAEILVIVAAVAAAGGGYDYPSSGESAAVIMIFAVVLLAVFILSIVYRAKIISSLGAVKKTVRTGNSVYRVSGFAGVMNFIIAFCFIFTIFTGSLYSILSGLCSIISLVCFALALFKFNRAMRRVSANPNTPYNNSQSHPVNLNGGYGQF